MKNQQDRPVIREMIREDCPSVESLFQSCFSNPWSLRALEEAADQEDYLHLVACQPERMNPQEGIMAYAGLKMVLDEGDVTNICVHPEWQGLGIGSRLMEEVRKMAAKKGICRIFLEVRRSNAPALALYRKADFRETGVRKDYYDNPKEDAILMMWQLEE